MEEKSEGLREGLREAGRLWSDLADALAPGIDKFNKDLDKDLTRLGEIAPVVDGPAPDLLLDDPEEEDE